MPFVHGVLIAAGVWALGVICGLAIVFFQPPVGCF